MERAGEYPVPSGPLAVRWLGHEVEPSHAGALGSARLALENAGSVAWRSRGEEGIQAAYHWLDERGNPIVWDGLRTALPRPVEPGEHIELELRVRAPIPPARYRLAFDLVDEHRCWFAELGNTPLELSIEVAPRIERALAVRGADPEALAGQEEAPVLESEASAVAYLAPGCLPAPDWSRRVLDAHAEGYAVVAGSIEALGGLLARRHAGALAPWAPGSGRNPAFAHPLLCPSIVAGVEAVWLDDVEGLPALARPTEEPWLYDGRIALRARLRSGRRRV